MSRSVCRLSTGGIASRPIRARRSGHVKQVGFTVEQRYAAADPLVAGHWLPTAPGVGGPQQAAGQPSVISGRTARGGRAVLFGTEPLFRAHPRGLYAEFARALYWSAT
jgi:hypothetical protein